MSSSSGRRFLLFLLKPSLEATSRGCLPAYKGFACAGRSLAAGYVGNVLPLMCSWAISCPRGAFFYCMWGCSLWPSHPSWMLSGLSSLDALLGVRFAGFLQSLLRMLWFPGSPGWPRPRRPALRASPSPIGGYGLPWEACKLALIACLGQ